MTVRGRYVGKTRGGKPLAVPFIHVWTVDDGRIVRAIAAANTAMFREALGGAQASSGASRQAPLTPP